MDSNSSIATQLRAGDYKTLARCITIVENEYDRYEKILHELAINHRIPIIGITGPPGAGKSTLLNGIIKNLLDTENVKIGVIVVDPSSPFHHGALLGDRIRMSEHFNHPNVFIRSLATRGSLGGLSAKTIEISDIMRASGFDYIFIETVGVGQSEVEIAGLADCTVLVLVPEGGDEIQTIKAGIMEIADVFVVNKSDRDNADTMIKNLHELAHASSSEKKTNPIVKTIATTNEGIPELIAEIKNCLQNLSSEKENKKHLLAHKAFQLILHQKIKTISQIKLEQDLIAASKKENFNLYVFVERWLLENK